MSFTTNLIGPWDHLTTNEKVPVSALVPRDVKERMFTTRLTRRGASDKVIASCVFMLDAWLCEHADEFNADIDYEELINDIINHLIKTLKNTQPNAL